MRRLTFLLHQMGSRAPIGALLPAVHERPKIGLPLAITQAAGCHPGPPSDAIPRPGNRREYADGFKSPAPALQSP